MNSLIIWRLRIAIISYCITLIWLRPIMRCKSQSPDSPLLSSRCVCFVEILLTFKRRIVASFRALSASGVLPITCVSIWHQHTIQCSNFDLRHYRYQHLLILSPPGLKYGISNTICQLRFVFDWLHKCLQIHAPLHLVAATLFALRDCCDEQ